MEEKPIVSTPPTEAPVEEAPKTEPLKTEDADKEGTAEPRRADPLLDDHYRTNPFFYEVAEYFNVESRDYDVAAPKLATIVEWIVSKFDVHKPEDILVKLRAAEDMVQRPGWDEKRYTNLFKYARLDQQELAIKKAKSAFERTMNGSV